MMESAFGWIGKIADFIGAFFPHIVIVEATHGAVKFIRGHKVVKLDPGWYLYWPLTTTVHLYPTARQAEELRAQTIVTSDNKVIIVGGMLVYEVNDVEKLVAHTYMPEQAIKDISLTSIHDVCCRMSWEEISTEQRKGTLDTKLKNEIKKALDPYGVTVLKAMLTDLAPSKVLRLIQSTAKGED